MRKFIPLFLMLSACDIQPHESNVPEFPNPEVAAQAPNSPEPAEPSVSWDQVRVQLERAIESGHRGNSMTYSWDDEQAWIKSIWSLEGRAQVYAYIILGEDGSYSDVVIPYMGELINVYWNESRDSQIIAKDRLRVAQIMFADLLFVLTKLDEQIKAYHDCFSRLEKKEGHSSLEEALCPGLPIFMGEAEQTEEDRDWDAYHKPERNWLLVQSTWLKDASDLSQEKFDGVIKTFPGRLGQALRYIQD